MATNNSGQVEGTYTYTPLPFGDGFSVNGADDDTYHFAGMDYDFNSGYTGTAHAQFRQYYNANGLWMSPDQFSGSYDITNTQSFNRYAYVMNNPSSMADPSGREGCLAAIAAGGETGTPVGVGAGLVGCFLEILGIDSFFESLFGGPKFHGTLNPRPTSQPWNEHNIHYGANVAAALGLPDAGCEFGACGGMPSDLVQGVNGQTGATVSFPDGYFYCGDFVCAPDHRHVALAPASIQGIHDSSGIIFAGVGAAGYVASDIGAVEAGQLFGTRFGGNEPLFNSGDSLRVGWSYIRATGQYVFRIGGTWVGAIKPNPHINLWPPSWWFR